MSLHTGTPPPPRRRSLVEAALFLADLWPVFPCGADKRPITAHGFKDATRDPDAIREMFARPGAALIGVPTGEASDLAVIDLDVKGGAPGLEWLAAHAHRLPQTRQHATRSGGRHVLFRYPEGRRIRNSARKIAPGVDVRGEGGYVIAPPSDGYTIADDAMPAAMPAWLVDLLDPPRAPAPPPAPRAAPRDGDGTPYGLAALRSECEAIRTAGDGGKHYAIARGAYSIGGWVAAGELVEGPARAALADAVASLRDRCDDYRAAEKTLAECFKAGMDAPRQAPPPRLVRRVTEEYAPPEPPPRDEPPDHWRYEPEPDQPLEAIKRDFLKLLPHPDGTSDAPAQITDGGQPNVLPLVYWEDIQPAVGTADFVEGLLLEGAMSVIYGPSNCGKTFFMTDLALHVATGRPWRGREIEPGGVIYCALEGGHGISNRVAAFRKRQGLEGVEVPFAIIPVALDLRDPAGDVERVKDAIRAAASRFGVPVKLVVMDTLSRAMAGGNENSPEDMGALVAHGDAIRQATKAHLAWVHHSGKDQAQGARGHSLLRAATDTEIEIGRPDKDSPSTARVTKQRELEIDGEWVFGLEVVQLSTDRRGKPVTSCVVVDAEARERRDANLPAGARFGLKALHEALAEAGRPSTHKDVPAWARVVPLEAWRREFYARSHLENQEARKKAFQRAIRDLRDLNVVGVLHEQAWLADRDDPA